MIAEFLKICTVADPAAETPTGSLADAFERWCRGKGREPIGRPVFARRLTEAGFPPVRGSAGRRMRRGLRLRGDVVALGGDLPPADLRPETAAWWAEIVTDYDLEPSIRPVLTAAARLWDRAASARAVLAEHGLVYVDRFGQPKERPEVAVERQSLNAFRLALRELELGTEKEPPTLGGFAR